MNCDRGGLRNPFAGRVVARCVGSGDLAYHVSCLNYLMICAQGQGLHGQGPLISPRFDLTMIPKFNSKHRSRGGSRVDSQSSGGVPTEEGIME